MNSNRGASAPTQPVPAKEPTPGSSRTLDLTVAKLTDTGRSRPFNEDYVDFYIPSDPQQRAHKGAIYLVADGMGGHQAGEVASQGAVEVVIDYYYRDTTHDIGTSLVRAFRAANQQLYEQAQADPSKAGMGTTLVAAVVLGRKVYVGVIVVLVSAMMHGPNEHRLKRLQQELTIDRRTLKRWQQWWTEIFVKYAFWKAERGRFRGQISRAQMPFCLVQTFGAQQMEGLVRLMKFLSPITTQSCPEVRAR